MTPLPSASHAPEPAPTDLDRWVEAHADALFRFAASRLADAAAAEDAVQETFLAALDARGSFRGEASERTWLVGILRHKIVDHLRRRGREQPLEAELEDAPAGRELFLADGHWRRPPSDWGADPVLIGESTEFWQVFAACRDDLPGRQAAVLTMRLIDDRPAEEICATLGITDANLWVLLHRARTRLRECLQRKWFDP